MGSLCLKKLCHLLRREHNIELGRLVVNANILIHGLLEPPPILSPILLEVDLVLRLVTLFGMALLATGGLLAAFAINDFTLFLGRLAQFGLREFAFG